MLAMMGWNRLLCECPSSSLELLFFFLGGGGRRYQSYDSRWQARRHGLI
jgi:hypothetical protein